VIKSDREDREDIKLSHLIRKTVPTVLNLIRYQQYDLERTLVDFFLISIEWKEKRDVIVITASELDDLLN